MKTLASRIAALADAYNRCAKTPDTHAEWLERHDAALREIERDELPHGSGIDSGCTIDREASGIDRIIVVVPFHCMDENGFYCGWRDYRVTVRPSFLGVSVSVSGRDYNGIKDYLADLFHAVMSSESAVGA